MTTKWDTFGLGTDNLVGDNVVSRRPLFCLAVDLDNNKIWCRINTDPNHYWNNSATADPATNTGGIDITSVNDGVSVMPGFAGFYNSSQPDICTANFGALPFRYTVPSGFSAWDASGTTTWNPSDKSSDFVLSNGNLTASKQATSNTWTTVRAIGSARHTGKWYYEATIDQYNNSDGNMIGFANASAPLNSWIASSGNGCAYRTDSTFLKSGSITNGAVGSANETVWYAARATDAHRHSGKWYFECDIDAANPTNGWTLGLVNTSFNLLNNIGATGNTSAGYGMGSRITFYKNGSGSNTGILATSAGHRMCIAADFDNNRSWARIDGGGWSSTSGDGFTGDPTANTGGNDIAVVNDGSSVMIGWAGLDNGGVMEQATLYTESADFVYSIPSDFTAWNIASGGAVIVHNSYITIIT